ncbi:hypothetical protein PMAYCL1PPCAC_26342, partial [Pristionchus mayeri]
KFKCQKRLKIIRRSLWSRAESHKVRIRRRVFHPCFLVPETVFLQTSDLSGFMTVRQNRDRVIESIFDAHSVLPRIRSIVDYYLRLATRSRLVYARTPLRLVVQELLLWFEIVQFQMLAIYEGIYRNVDRASVDESNDYCV